MRPWATSGAWPPSWWCASSPASIVAAMDRDQPEGLDVGCSVAGGPVAGALRWCDATRQAGLVLGLPILVVVAFVLLLAVAVRFARVVGLQVRQIGFERRKEFDQGRRRWHQQP